MPMDNNHSSESAITIRLWTYVRALKAAPYLRVSIRSLRERWLLIQRLQREVQRIDARPGRPDRRIMISRAETLEDLEAAEQDFIETVNELLNLDVYCVDPVQGVALIPFAQDENLAWFVFELFAPEGLVAWRYHADPLEARRFLADTLDPEVWTMLPATTSS